MGEAGLEVCAGFLVGGVSTCPLVGGAGSLGPPVGKAMSRGMSRGGCGLRKSFDSLSADGWGCIPIQFVVWPEASQHWSLEAVGWGQVFVLMTQARCQPPARVHADEHSPIFSPPGSMSPG